MSIYYPNIYKATLSDGFDSLAVDFGSADLQLIVIDPFFEEESWQEK